MAYAVQTHPAAPATISQLPRITSKLFESIPTSSSNNNSEVVVWIVSSINIHDEIGRTLHIDSYKLNSEHLISYTNVEKVPEPESVPLLNASAYDQQYQLELNSNSCW